MKAVMWTDVFQTIIMFVGLLASVIQGKEYYYRIEVLCSTLQVLLMPVEAKLFGKEL